MPGCSETPTVQTPERCPAVCASRPQRFATGAASARFLRDVLWNRCGGSSRLSSFGELRPSRRAS
eukprot:11965117-Alexandrium_andersonii.AAC.1